MATEEPEVVSVEEHKASNDEDLLVAPEVVNEEEHKSTNEEDLLAVDVDDEEKPKVVNEEEHKASNEEMRENSLGGG